jgi:hypothetical protein
MVMVDARRASRRRSGRIAAIALIAGVICATAAAQPRPGAPPRGAILSAFFGLDRSLRIAVAASWACRGYPGTDGMPLVLSHEIDPDTLDREDFEVTTASGKKGSIRCVSLRPATDPGELRTVLLIGHLGSAEDQPATVKIVGDIRSLDGSLNFRGATASVIPLEAGPTLVLAEALPRDQWPLGGIGDCPADGLAGIVRVTWAGGVRKPNGDEIGAVEMEKYRVTLRQADGRTVVVKPKAIGDLNDQDNNHELCLGVAGTPISVFFPAGLVVDPRGDRNPDTRIAVTVPR